MKFFKALKKLITYLTQEEDVIKYEEPLIQDLQEKVEEQDLVEEEETTLDTTIDNIYVTQVRDWALKKINLLHEEDRHRNARALAAEFDEWINIPEDADEIDYLCLEEEGWTDEEELDIR